MIPLGSIVHLTSVMVKARIKAEQTMPDTPNMYAADLEVMDDRGGMDLAGLAGKSGVDGQAQFAYRNMDDGTPYERYQDLPTDLTDSLDDIGKYWVIPVYDEDGVVTEQWAWVWRGSALGYRKTYMGSIGPAGPVPRIKPSADLIDPELQSFIDTSGTTLSPSWRFNTAVPIGPPGVPRPVNEMPDVTSVPVNSMEPGMLLMHDGARGTSASARGKALWKATSLTALMPRFYSVPESVFSDYFGTFENIRGSAKVSVGQFTVPGQPFDWTPVVWGHTSTGQFFNASQIGLEVRMNSNSGTLIARGYGNQRGEVSVFPHYSDSKDLNANVSPTNDYAVIEADQPVTLYMNLTNEGLFGIYNFESTNAQLMVMVSPIDAYRTFTGPTTRRIR